MSGGRGGGRSAVDGPVHVLPVGGASEVSNGVAGVPARTDDRVVVATACAECGAPTGPSTAERSNAYTWRRETS